MQLILKRQPVRFVFAYLRALAEEALELMLGKLLGGSSCLDGSQELREAALTTTGG